MDWKNLLSEQERTEIEHAQIYAKLLRHPISEGARLILIAKLADALDRATGSGTTPELTPEAMHERRDGASPTA